MSRVQPFPDAQDRDELESKVLDHGYVRYVAHMGTDESIIEAARMSTAKGFEGWDDKEVCPGCGYDRPPAWDALNQHHAPDCKNLDPEWKVKKGDAHLLEFLYRNKHMTPFEMCELSIEVYAPIMVFREWHRHRTQSFNEFSARYSVMPNEHYAPDVERFKPNTGTNKQAASLTVSQKTLQDADAHEAVGRVMDEQNAVYSTYEKLLGEGVPKEVARINTPVSRYSKMRAKTDLRNWLGFLNLRMRSNAQWEIRQYANAVAKIIKRIWPRTYALFETYDLKAVTFAGDELEALEYACKVAHEEGGADARLDAILKKLRATP